MQAAMQAAAAMRYTQAATSSVARAATTQRHSAISSSGSSVAVAAARKRLFATTTALHRATPPLRLSTVQRASPYTRGAVAHTAPFRSALAAAAHPSRAFSSSAHVPIGGDGGGRALVAWGERDGVTTPANEFMPVGQLPKLPNLLVVPVVRPVMPGLAFDFDLRLYPIATRVALQASIAGGQPYATLVMLREDAREAVRESARAGGWTREELVREDLEPEAEPQAQVPMQGMDHMRQMFDEAGLGELLAGTSADPKSAGKRSVAYPLLTDIKQLHTIGVAAEIKIVNDKAGNPRLHGLVHRRVHVLGSLEDAAPATEGAAVAATDAPAPADAAADAGTPSDASAQPMLPPLNALHVRVKHLDDAPSVPESILATADGVATPAATAAAADAAEAAAGSGTSTGAAPSTSTDELEEKAYVKEINQTVAELSSEENVASRIKKIARVARHMNTTSSPARVADLAAHISSATEAQLQTILETLDVRARLAETLWLWKKESEEVRLRKAIARNVREKYELLHAKHQLKEQKKVIEEMMSAAAKAAAQEAEEKAEEEAKKSGTVRPPPPPPKGNDKESLRQRFLHRISASNGRTVPEYAAKVIEEEMAKLAGLDTDASEYQITRNYVDWLTSIPWGVLTPEKFDLDFAETLLNKEHYGLEEVKQRILEFVASAMLLNHVPPGKIICLVGPPGVGKTSIGKSIAAALSRQFYRFSVGGLEDVSEIKGHRRTYVGALPGKLVQALKRTDCSNPVILIDEIDKLGRGVRGDPASALLEVLDPEQNNAFTDHYLDVPIDLSKVLFICTANERSHIPGPLADRMDFIQLSGYVLQEKVHIAQEHLLPLVRTKTGVDASSLTLTDEALLHLIRWYCREAGVRGLQKQLEKIFRKVALKIARAHAQEEEELAAAKAKDEAAATVAAPSADVAAPVSEAEIVAPASAVAAAPIPAAATPVPSSRLALPIVVDPSNLWEYVGKPVHNSDRMYDQNPVGVATGLGTNSMGGWLLYTECTTADQAVTLPPEAMRIPTAGAPASSADKEKEKDKSRAPQPLGRGELFCTGQLGDVIRESSSIAYTVAKRLVAKYTHPLSAHRNFFSQHRIHLHLPEGATPKDGPSAGIAMVTALMSLALQTPPLHAHAMTGELTLTGLVLPIGGVKEKLMAAKHANIRLVVLPAENRKDVEELKEYVTEGLEIHYATTYDDVFKLIFPHFQDSVPVSVPLSEGAPVAMDALAGSGAKGKKKQKRSDGTMPSPLLPAVDAPSSGTQPNAE